MGPNIPATLKGWGKMGRFARAILQYAISAHISQVIIKYYPSGSTATPTVTLKPTASGTTLEMTLRGGGGASAYPFQLIDASNPTDGAQIRVRYGTVFDLSTEWIPDGMVAGDSPPCILPVTADGVVWLHVETDPTSLAVVGVEVDNGATMPSSTATDSYKGIGTYTYDSGTDTVASIAQSVRTSLGYLNANSDHVYWEV
jgi:hypothetical protein